MSIRELREDLRYYMRTKIEEINDELKKSLYDEIVKGVKHEIEELFDNNTLYYFVIELLDKIKTEFVFCSHRTPKSKSP